MIVMQDKATVSDGDDGQNREMGTAIEVTLLVQPVTLSVGLPPRLPLLVLQRHQ